MNHKKELLRSLWVGTSGSTVNSGELELGMRTWTCYVGRQLHNDASPSIWEFPKIGDPNIVP